MNVSESMISKEQDQDDFVERKQHRNVALVVEGRHFWIPRDSLAEHSPVFANMLFGEFQESKKDEIELPDKKSEDILEMLRCLIPNGGILKEISYENIAILVTLADEYQIAFLEHRCAQFIQSITEGHSVIKDLFLTGQSFGLKKVVRALLPMLARFDLAEVRPILDQVPDQMRSAIFYQIIGQPGHQTMETCYECACLCGKECRGYSCNKSERETVKKCLKCSICHKSTAWERDRDGKMRKDQKCCRCLAPFALAELEKMGF